jgi:ceramide glucosyltransferase
MPILVLSAAQIAGVLLGAGGLAYLALALRSVRRFKERPARVDGWRPPVSVLKPVCGSSPQLYECLRSFCEQDWASYEVIFGAHSEDDPAVEVVRRLIREFPERDLRLVVDSALAGPNRKAANLANIYRSARYDIIVLSDSDVRVDGDCLASMAAPFAKPSVGAVASIYKGWAIGGAPARFGALYINDWFVPSVVVDVDLRGIDFVFAMSAVRREALEAIGGFAQLAQFFADDYALGRLISRKGWKVVLSTYACDTVVAERSFAEMFQHEVRWQRTERACRPLDQLMSVVTWPLPLLLVLLLPQLSLVGLGVIGAEVTLRILLHFQVRRSFHIAGPHQPWLVPLRECVCFLTWAAGLFGDSVHWGKDVFSIKTYRKLMAADTRAEVESGTPGVKEHSDRNVGEGR